MSKTILIIDDEKTIRWSLGEALREDGYDTLEAENGKGGLTLFKNKSADLVILDLKMPGENGIDILKEIKSIDPAVPVIMITAYGEIDTAVEVMKLGAFDFVLKPFSLEKLKITIRNAFEN